MPVSAKWELLRRMRSLIDGLFGEWAQEANAHIDGMENNMLNDKAFSEALKEWNDKLLPQCPGGLWMDMRKGRVAPPAISATM